MDHDGRVGHDDMAGTVVFDLDGVVYLGTTPISGATDTIRALSDDGWQILFATNNSEATAESVAQILTERATLAVQPSAIITSAMATVRYLQRECVASAFVIGSRQLEDTIRSGGVVIVESVDADAVIVGLDRSLTEATIDRACQAIRRGAVFVATNTDRTFPTPHGPSAGAGTTVDAIADASGSSFVVCGKPHEPMAELVASRLMSDNVWMVGDRLETDIAFAKQGGWTSVLTLSGVTDKGVEFPEGLEPDFVVDSIAELPDVLDKATKRRLNEG
jgi:4-nitrophenyl phosphatase